MNKINLIIITGLSGAGKSQALRSLEDLGFFCVDNLPPTFLPKFIELCARSEGRIQRVAMVIDIRGGEFFDSLFEALELIERGGFLYRILFLEASDETLVRRFKETRRPHPLALEGRVLEGIRLERKRLNELRGRAHYIVDTTDLTPRQLREEIRYLLSGELEPGKLLISIVSFGFKFGLPLDADLVFDVRFLPNPYYVETLRPLTGTDREVREYVLRWPVTKRFIRRLASLIKFLIPHYANEGKAQLTIAIGCTGGRHRSLVIAERLTEILQHCSYRVVLEHRDVGKND